MRFTTAWAKVAAQNVTLKFATITLGITTIVQLILISNLSNRNPIIVERTCYSRALSIKSSDPTEDEIKAFLVEALSMRFDTDGYSKAGFLSLAETAAREKEQAALKDRQMTQKIIISTIHLDGKDVSVESDRLITIGIVKSALPLNLKITLQQTNRTESNPYGLIVDSINQLEEKK